MPRSPFTGLASALSLASAFLALGPSLVSAQDLAITNARIVVGNGEVIESGTLLVRDGRIVEVGDKRVDTGDLDTIDAGGLTAVPGIIDAHRHINTGPDERAQMQALLEAGYTTVLSGGGPADGGIYPRLPRRVVSADVDLVLRALALHTFR